MTQIAFEYGNTLHRNAGEMLDNIVADYITAGGRNDYAEVANALSQSDNEKLAREIVANFGLKDLLDRNGVAEGELVEAVARFRDERTAVDRMLDAFLEGHFIADGAREVAAVRSILELDDEDLIDDLFENHGLDDLMEELGISDAPVIAAMARYRSAHA